MLSQLSPAERVERVLAPRWRKPSKARVCGSSAVRGSEERGGQAARGCYLTSPEEYYNQCISHNTRALLVFSITGVIQISYLNK